MMNKNNLFISLFALLLILVSPNALAGPFSEGSSRVSVAFANGRLLNKDYFVIGVGGGYYFADGFEAGLDVDVWTGDDPSIYEITPTLQYVFQQSPALNPYLGVFYNRTYIENLPDSDAAGYRVGVYVPAGQNAYFGFGVVNSKLQDCTDTVFLDCSDTYTELTLMFSL